jgi:hypothetical protein
MGAVIFSETSVYIYLVHSHIPEVILMSEYALIYMYIYIHMVYVVVLLYVSLIVGPPLWSGGQSSWLQSQSSRVRFPSLPDFLKSSGSGTVSTRPR